MSPLAVDFCMQRFEKSWRHFCVYSATRENLRAACVSTTTSVLLDGAYVMLTESVWHVMKVRIGTRD